MTRTPLDQLIIDANALNVHTHLGTPLDTAKVWAAEVWDEAPEGVREKVRDLYRPTYHAVSAHAIEEAVSGLDTMIGGAGGAPYVSAAKAHIRTAAHDHRQLSEKE